MTAWKPDREAKGAGPGRLLEAGDASAILDVDEDISRRRLMKI
ncbi:MAG: hypothetical protein AB1700_02925 [Bacillota bacterium]